MKSIYMSNFLLTYSILRCITSRLKLFLQPKSLIFSFYPLDRINYDFAEQKEEDCFHVECGKLARGI